MEIPDRLITEELVDEEDDAPLDPKPDAPVDLIPAAPADPEPEAPKEDTKPPKSKELFEKGDLVKVNGIEFRVKKWRKDRRKLILKMSKDRSNYPGAKR